MPKRAFVERLNKGQARSAYNMNCNIVLLVSIRKGKGWEEGLADGITVTGDFVRLV